MLKAITPFKLSLLFLIFSICQALTAGYCSYTHGGGYFFNFWNQQTQKCEKICSGGYYRVYSTRQCYKKCPELYFKYETSKHCQNPCDVNSSGYYYSTKTNSCVPHCYSNGNNQFFNNETLKCQDFCPVGMKPDAQTGFCLTQNELCPLAFFKNQNPKSCALSCNNYGFYEDFISGRCVGAGECSYDSVNKIQTYGGQSFECVDQCPDKLYSDPSTKMCTQVCPVNYPYKDYVKRECSASPVNYSILYSIFHDQDGNLAILAVIICIGIHFLLILMIIGYLIYQRWKKRGLLVLPPQQLNPNYHIGNVN